MKYYFNAKPNVDYKKYGFVEDDTEWVVWRNTRRITIKKRDMSMQFNMLTNEMLKIFMDMVKDNVVILVKTSGIRKPKPHCLDLTDEEYEAVLKMRDKKRHKYVVIETSYGKGYRQGLNDIDSGTYEKEKLITMYE